MKILIATPAFGRELTVDYFLSIRALEAFFRQRHIASDISLTIGSLVSKSRNALASILLLDNGFTHILFVDNDMAFRPEAIEKLMQSNKEFCGLICPSRQIDHGKLHGAARMIEDPIVARNVGQTYIGLEGLETVEQDGARSLVGDAGLYRTTRLGCGITLIAKSVLLKMRERFPSLLLAAGTDPGYVTMGATYDILQVFDSLQDEHNIVLGEDLSFSLRWTRDCGGEIWACIDEEIGHVGAVRVVGKASDYLRQQGMTMP